MERVAIRRLDFIGLFRVPGLGVVGTVLTGANPTSAGPTIDCQVWLYPTARLVEVVSSGESAIYDLCHCLPWPARQLVEPPKPAPAPAPPAKRK